MADTRNFGSSARAERGTFNEKKKKTLEHKRSNKLRYKIATLRGGRNFLPEPSRSFRRHFTSTRLKFESCAFTWEALISFSAHKGQPAFQDVMSEILALAQIRGNPLRPVLDETVVMCEHAFVSKQLKDVDCGGNSKRKARFLDVLGRRGEKVLRKRDVTSKMMDDLDLVEMQRSLGEPVVPIWRPESTNSSFLFDDVKLTTTALSVWCFLRTFSHTLQLEQFNLDELQASLVQQDESSKNGIMLMSETLKCLVRFVVKDRSTDLDGSVAAQDHEKDESGVFDSLERLLWYGIFPRNTVVVASKNVRVATRNTADIANAYSALVGILSLFVLEFSRKRR